MEESSIGHDLHLKEENLPETKKAGRFL